MGFFSDNTLTKHVNIDNYRSYTQALRHWGVFKINLDLRSWTWLQISSSISLLYTLYLITQGYDKSPRLLTLVMNRGICWAYQTPPEGSEGWVVPVNPWSVHVLGEAIKFILQECKASLPLQACAITVECEEIGWGPTARRCLCLCYNGVNVPNGISLIIF